jgi:hypothetical protein
MFMKTIFQFASAEQLSDNTAKRRVMDRTVVGRVVVRHIDSQFEVSLPIRNNDGRARRNRHTAVPPKNAKYLGG